MRPFENYVVAKNIQHDKRMKAMLLHYAGEAVFELSVVVNDSTWLTSTSCLIISAVFAGILAEVANVLDKDSLHASVSVQGCGGD